MHFNSTANQNKIFWLLISLTALILRYQYFPDVFTNQGFIAANTDTYYRLHRIVHIVNQPGLFNFSYPLFESKLHFPQGLQVAWPLGLDLLFAIPLKILGVRDITSIMFLCFIVVPLLIFPMMYLIAHIARKESNGRAALLAAFLLGVMPSLVVQTLIGDIDHHAIGCLFVMVVYALTQNLKSNRDVAVLGLVVGLTPSIDPHAWLVCPMLSMMMLVNKNQKSLLQVAKSLLVGFGLSCFMLSLSSRFTSGYFSFTGFSWWSPMILAVTSSFVYGLYVLRGKNKINVTKIKAVAFSVVIVGVIFVLRKFSASFNIGGQISGAMDWLVFKKGTIGQTTESLSMFSYPMKLWHELWLLFIVLVIDIWMIRRNKHVAMICFSIIPVVLSFFQTRFFTIASPWLILLVVFFIEDVTVMFASKIKQRVWFIASVLCLMFCFYSSVRLLKARTTSVVHEYFWAIRDASKFLRIYQGASNAGASQDPGAIIAPWDEGHWILFFSELPVVADPFQGRTAVTTNELFSSQNDDALDQFYQTTPAKYLMVEQSVPRTFELLKYMGKNPKDYFSVDSTGPVKKIGMLLPYEKILTRRYYASLGTDDNGNFPDHWRLIYVSGYPAADVPSLPALKVFEHVPGAKIRFQSSQPDLYLKGYVSDRSSQYQLAKKGVASANGEVEWNLPYGETKQGGVVCNGYFVIVNAHNKIVKTLPKITNEQVVHGDIVSLK